MHLNQRNFHNTLTILEFLKRYSVNKRKIFAPCLLLLLSFPHYELVKMIILLLIKSYIIFVVIKYQITENIPVRCILSTKRQYCITQLNRVYFAYHLEHPGPNNNSKTEAHPKSMRKFNRDVIVPVLLL